MSNRMTISALDGSGQFAAYVAAPDAGPRPTIIVVQEVFGINANIRALCAKWAALGYVAIAPDLFWRLESGVDLDPNNPDHMQKAFTLYSKFDVDKGMEDIKATLAAARANSACTGKVGIVGYCLGGLLAYLAAARTDADASVGYYGVGIQNFLSEASQITKPLILHIAGQDKFVDSAAQAQMHTGLDAHSHITLFDYPQCDHAFTRMNGEHYDAVAAELANSRTVALFEEQLR